MTGPKIYSKDFFSFDKDDSLISEYLTRIVSTTPGEMLNKPYFGSKIKSYIFGYSHIIRQDIEREINRIFTDYLGGYAMSNFSLKEDVQTLTIELTIVKTTTQEVINFSQSFALIEK